MLLLNYATTKVQHYTVYYLWCKFSTWVPVGHISMKWMIWFNFTLG